MTISPSDILFWAGGSCLRKFGTASRRTAPISRGGEEIKETFTRAAPNAYGLGRDALVGYGTDVPRFEYLDPLTSGTKDPYWLLEDTRTNIILQSENFGTTWSAAGTPTRVAADHTVSGVTLDLIGDDDAVAAESYSQSFSFTGDAVKAFSIHVKQGTSTSSFIRLRDQVASANRLATLLTWSAGLPVLTTSIGTYYGYHALADGVFRLLFATTSVTAANSHQVLLYVASLTTGPEGTATGTLYMGGVMVENAISPSSYQKTTTIAVARAREAASYPYYAPPQAMTLYARFVERGSVLDTVADRRVIHIGDHTTNYVSIASDRGSATPEYMLQVANATGSTIATLPNGSAPTYGQLVELRLVLTPTTAQLFQSKNLAAEESTGAGAPSAITLATAFSTPILYLNGDQGTANTGWIAFDTAAVIKGAPTLTELRALRA